MHSQIGIRAISFIVFAAALAGCATSPAETGSTAIEGGKDLGCILPTNCVTTIGSSGMPPLRFSGTAAAGIAQVRATLLTYPEAVITRAEDDFIEAVFSTRAGFKDTVSFRAHAAEQKIDFRSRSSFGLFDFGKNRSRMTELSERFAKMAGTAPAKN